VSLVLLTYDPEDGGYGALNDGEAEAVEAALHPIVWPALAVQVVVRDVSREINRKPEQRIKIIAYSFELYKRKPVFNLIALDEI
jgi:hypothetical protein